jgi:hypothetical protein
MAISVAIAVAEREINSESAVISRSSGLSEMINWNA